jgi:hypothetical protein
MDRPNTLQCWHDTASLLPRALSTSIPRDMTGLHPISCEQILLRWTDCVTCIALSRHFGPAEGAGRALGSFQGRRKSEQGPLRTFAAGGPSCARGAKRVGQCCSKEQRKTKVQHRAQTQLRPQQQRQAEGRQGVRCSRMLAGQCSSAVEYAGSASAGAGSHLSVR